MKLSSRHLLVAVLASAAALSTTNVASAAPTGDKSASSITVDLELTETLDSKRKGDSLQATLTVVDDHGCASLETDRGSSHYEIKVCHQGGDAAAPVLGIEIGRSVRRRDAASSQRFRVTAKLAAGQRVVVGRLAQGDGATEIAARVQ